jgi:hypothetical protein
MVQPIYQQLIRVAYPIGNGRIVLRTEQDWEKDVEARSVTQEGCVAEFWIPTGLGAVLSRLPQSETR